MYPYIQKSSRISLYTGVALFSFNPLHIEVQPRKKHENDIYSRRSLIKAMPACVFYQNFSSPASYLILSELKL